MSQALQIEEPIVHEHSIVHLKITANWKDGVGEHFAIQHIEKFNVWRDMDLLPQPIMDDILHHGVGKGKIHHFHMGELIANWQLELVKTLPLKNFNGHLNNGYEVIPRAGRYYPKGWFRGVNGIYSENMFPARVVDIDEKNITVDYNHPMAKYELGLEIEIIDIFSPSDEHGGRCVDVIETLLTNGPGMQLPEKDNSTDFFQESAFSRVDENNDSEFYQTFRNVHHLDGHARNTISGLYSELIHPASRILDLMASWESHIPEALTHHLSAIGMNEDELRLNPDINEYRVHDLNVNPSIPFSDGSFDAVVCTASVEYLTQPLKVFKEIQRILKPGGVCIMSFSNRWFPTKAISLWSEMHDFERLGLVMEYFRQSGWKHSINAFSCRGLHRSEDDPHYAKTQVSDPVYAVWSHK